MSYCSHWENADDSSGTWIANPIYGDDEGEGFRIDNPGANGGSLAGEYDRRFYYLPTCTDADARVTDDDGAHGEDSDGDSFLCDYNDTNNYNEGFFNTGADKFIGKAALGGNDEPSRNAIMPPENGSLNTSGYEQFEFYLISPDGSKKPILRRIGNCEDDDHDGSIDENAGNFTIANADGNELIGIGEMTAQDIDGDTGRFLDGYRPDNDFNLDNHDILDDVLSVDDFISIVPSQIEIVDLSFIIAPLDDPRKAYNENGNDIQIQPHVMILLTARPSEKLSRKLVGENFEISVQTMVSSRVLNKVLFPSS